MLSCSRCGAKLPLLNRKVRFCSNCGLHRKGGRGKILSKVDTQDIQISKDNKSIIKESGTPERIKDYEISKYYDVQSLTQEKEFKVNKYITLKLEEYTTNIYVKEKLFRQCKFLLIEVPIEEITSFDEIESIDEAAEKLDSSLEDNETELPPETEFWGHCSNLQAWAENNYSTRLLHRNIAFPLLKQLTEVGDPLAKKVFKEEIAKRFTSGYIPVIKYLLFEGYLNNFNREERETLFSDPDIIPIITLDLRDRSLTVLPEHVTKFKLLQTLYLSRNQLMTLPESIGDLTSLLDLNLSGNQLKTIPESIGNLSSLKRLYLYSNKLTTLPESIRKLTSLQDLNLNNNELNTIPESIENLTSLLYLNLSDNQLKTIPESIGNLTSLLDLNLSGNQLKTIPESMIKLKSLQTLHLSGNQLKTIPESIVILEQRGVKIYE